MLPVHVVHCCIASPMFRTFKGSRTGDGVWRIDECMDRDHKPSMPPSTVGMFQEKGCNSAD